MLSSLPKAGYKHVCPVLLDSLCPYRLTSCLELVLNSEGCSGFSLVLCPVNSGYLFFSGSTSLVTLC